VERFRWGEPDEEAHFLAGNPWKALMLSRSVSRRG
jgi:hypothetical protein